ncbi:MAG TPA: C1 family peptidase [Candidatus Dormibacteraeota bacterium]|nr:C1 family peptidase [Candidatus Dormibacteraeota bacterium]
MSKPSPSAALSVDLRSLMAPIRDQGRRGTCLAFAATAAHEVGRSAGAAPEDLSEEALYWGCKRIDGNWNAGTTFGSASAALGRWGQPLEADWPYDATRADGVAYSFHKRPGGSGWFQSGLRKISVALSAVRTHLDDGTLVLLALTVFDTFFQPDAAGHIADPPSGSSARGRHAVLAVGHQTDQILIRNSWGNSWALGGYAWIGDGYIGAHAGDAWIIDATAGTPEPTRTDQQEAETYGTR